MGWDYFFCEVEGERATIAVDLDLAAPQDERPYLVYFRLVREEYTRFDISEEVERSLFERIENTLRAAAEASHAVYAGRASTPTTRTFVFYAPRRVPLEGRLEQSFGSLEDYGYTFYVRTLSDAGWAVYRDFLLPGPNERAEIERRWKQA
jgi:hypothetical protein